MHTFNNQHNNNLLLPNSTAKNHNNNNHIINNNTNNPILTDPNNNNHPQQFAYNTQNLLSKNNTNANNNGNNVFTSNQSLSHSSSNGHLIDNYGNIVSGISLRGPPDMSVKGLASTFSNGYPSNIYMSHDSPSSTSSSSIGKG